MEQSVHLFIFDGLSDWEPGFAVAGLNNPAFQRYPGRYRVNTVACRKGPIVTMGGLRVAPDLLLDELEPAKSALLILPGGVAWDEGRNLEAIEKARAFLKARIPVAAICGATAGLARGGVLDDRSHTSNAREYLAATGYGGRAHYVEAPAVTDDGLITASGVAPVDFAHHIFRCLEVYEPKILEAWYGLFKTGQAEYYSALVQAAQEQTPNRERL